MFRQLKMYYCFSLIVIRGDIFCSIYEVIIETFKCLRILNLMNQISEQDCCYHSYTSSKWCRLDRLYWLDRRHILDEFLLLALHLPPGPGGSWSWRVGQEPPLASWRGLRFPGSWKASWSLLHSLWKRKKILNIYHIGYYTNSKNVQCLQNVATC